MDCYPAENQKGAQLLIMESLPTNRPIVIFAKSSAERDYLRNVLSGIDKTVLCFENETICFDNLASIEPQLILVRTDSKATAWRFVFAMNALKVAGRLLLLSNAIDAGGLEPDAPSKMVHLVQSAKSTHGMMDRILLLMNDSGRSLAGNRPGFLIGTTAAIRSINSKLQSLIQTSAPVLIEGEKGTGKELLARLIAHRENKHSIVIKVDCEAFVAAKADGSRASNISLYDQINEILQSNSTACRPITALFSKIDRLDLKSQSEIMLFWEKEWDKLPQRAESGRRDLRFIATSDVKLESLVERNLFRKELFYRLNVIPIFLPPLRARKEDIPQLADHFAIHACAELRRSFLFPTPLMAEQLSVYDWPGNLDELRSAMERLAASGDEVPILRQNGFRKLNQNPLLCLFNSVSMDVMPDSAEIQDCLATMGNTSLRAICDNFISKTEKRLLRKALETTSWNRKKAAALLHISYKSMLNKMKMYEII